MAMKNGRVEYYQVAQTTLDDKVLERELAPLKKIRDNFPKYLLTLDDLFGEMNYEGIEKHNVLKWMLEQTTTREAKHRLVVEKCWRKRRIAASVEGAYAACDDKYQTGIKNEKASWENTQDAFFMPV